MFVQLILSIVMGTIFGFVCSNFARNRGRNPMLWFQLGFFFGILALLLLYILSWKDRLKAPKLAESAVAPSSQGQEEASKPTEDPGLTLDRREWHYLDADRQPVGPISFEELQKELDRGMIHEKLTYLWSEGMEKWKPLSELPYLKMVLKEKTTS